MSPTDLGLLDQKIIEKLELKTVQKKHWQKAMAHSRCARVRVGRASERTASVVVRYCTHSPRLDLAKVRARHVRLASDLVSDTLPLAGTSRRSSSTSLRRPFSSGLSRGASAGSSQASSLSGTRRRTIARFVLFVLFASVVVAAPAHARVAPQHAPIDRSGWTTTPGRARADRAVWTSRQPRASACFLRPPPSHPASPRLALTRSLARSLTSLHSAPPPPHLPGATSRRT